MSGRVGRGLMAVALVTAAIGALAINPAEGSNALYSRTRSELALFTNWLRANGAQGYIGEVGWPNNADTPQWNALAQGWYADAAAANLWVSHWSTGEWWGTTYKLSSYVWGAQGGTLSVPRSPASVIESQAPERRGVNVNGADFGPFGTGLEPTSTLSNANPGVYNRDWHYDKQESFNYLASRGIRTIRLAFRWERVQPTLGGPLDPTELDRLVAAVGRARSAGLTVILNPQNYAAYWLFDGTQGVRRPIGSASVTKAHFADLWRRLSQQFAGDPGVTGYGLMNEPVGMNGSGGFTAAQIWEQASQAAVDAIRSNGDSKVILVPGYQWSHVTQFPVQHPRAWITDPAGNFRYEAHQYFDRNGSGSYSYSYAAEVADAEARGFNAPPAPPPPGDYDGNGTTDMAVFRPATGTWFVRNGPTAAWGMGGDLPVPGDYDGNRTTDMAVYRPSNGTWFVRNGTSAVWGLAGDVPVPGDYDGNGTTDMAVFRPSNHTWFVRNATGGVWGLAGDVPVPGDYDGNGTTDMAVFRPSTGTWHVRSGTTVTWGVNGDVPVPQDYDGNGTTDMAVYRPSTATWYVRDGTSAVWGTGGDIPAAGNYDGVGGMEMTVFRPGSGTWFIRGGPAVGWGTSGDVPLSLPYAIVRAYFPGTAAQLGEPGTPCEACPVDPGKQVGSAGGG